MTLAQKDMFTKRYRKVRRLEPSEQQIQIAIIDRWKYQGRKDAVCLHVPNGGERPKRQAALFKAMGVLPGASDLMFFWPERNALFLELKARNRVMSDEQEWFMYRMHQIGFFTEWADNLDDAIKVLKRYELLR